MNGGQYSIKLTIGSVSTSAQTLYVHGHGVVFLPGLQNSPTIDTTHPLLLRDATFNGNSVPIRAHASLVTLENITLLNTQHLDVSGAVIARNLTISNSVDTTAAIVVANGIDFTLDRATIHGSATAISAQTGSIVHLMNVMIWGSSSRALELSLAVGELESSTIADAGFASVSPPCAVTCGSGLHVNGSIIWQPTCVGGSNYDAVGACTFQNSIVSNATAPPGTTNVDPAFVNPSGFDFHIQPGSPAQDALDSGPDHDFEGDARPGGVRFDIGADEIP